MKYTPKTRKGIPNKKTVVVRDYLALQGRNLIDDLLQAISEVQEPAQKADLLLKLLPFAYPKLREKEISNEEEAIDVTPKKIEKLSDEELEKLANGE